MASEAEDSTPIRIVVEAPEHLKRGVYANTLQVRFTEHDFVIDCAQALPAESQEDVDAARASGRIVVPSVARIVVPLQLLPRIIKALQSGLENYERVLGPLPPARGRSEESDDD